MIVTIVVEMMVQRTVMDTMDEAIACRKDGYHNKCSQQNPVPTTATMLSHRLWSFDPLQYFLLRRVISAAFLDNAVTAGYHGGGGGGPGSISFSFSTTTLR